MLKNRQKSKVDVRPSGKQQKPSSAPQKLAQRPNRSDLISRSQKLLDALHKNSKSNIGLVSSGLDAPDDPGSGKGSNQTKKKRPRFSAHLSRIQKLREVAGIQGPLTGPASPKDKDEKRRKSARVTSARRRPIRKVTTETSTPNGAPPLFNLAAAEDSTNQKSSNSILLNDTLQNNESR